MTITAMFPSEVELPGQTWQRAWMRRNHGILEVTAREPAEETAAPRITNEMCDAKEAQLAAYTRLKTSGRLDQLHNKTASQLTQEERLALLEVWLRHNAEQPVCTMSDAELDEGRWQYLKARHLQ